MHSLFLRLLLPLCLFAGCVKLPPDPACCLLDTAPPLDETVQKALESGVFVTGEFPKESWWEMFCDPILNDLICHALSCSPTLQKVEQRVEAAIEEAQIARSRLFPTIGAGVAIHWRYMGKNDFFRGFDPAIPASVPEYLAHLDFQYEFDFWGKNRNYFYAAMGAAKEAQAEQCEAELILTTSVAAVYFELGALFQKLKVLEKEQKKVTRLFGLTQDRTQSALDSRFPLLDKEEHLFLMEKNILLTQEQIELTRHKLNRLIGEGPECEIELANILPHCSHPFPLPCHLSSDLLSRRPDLMAHIFAVEQMAHLVGAAKTEFYPRIDLAALGGLDSVFFSKLFSGGSLSATVVPSLHLPLFTAGRIRANLQKQQAEFHEKIYAYNQRLLEAVQEVADQVVSLEKREALVKVQNRVVKNRIKEWKLLQLRYQHSLSNQMEVLRGQVLVLEEQLEEIQRGYERTLAAIGLIKALGGGYFCQEGGLD